MRPPSCPRRANGSPACQSEQIEPVGHVTAFKGIIHVAHRCDACRTVFVFERKGDHRSRCHWRGLLGRTGQRTPSKFGPRSVATTCRQTPPAGNINELARAPRMQEQEGSMARDEGTSPEAQVAINQIVCVSCGYHRSWPTRLEALADGQCHHAEHPEPALPESLERRCPTARACGSRPGGTSPPAPGGSRWNSGARSAG
jgi:hypothetical protein